MILTKLSGIAKTVLTLSATETWDTLQKHFLKHWNMPTPTGAWGDLPNRWAKLKWQKRITTKV